MKKGGSFLFPCDPKFFVGKFVEIVQKTQPETFNFKFNFKVAV